ncbi:Kelch repeat-containing protein [Bradyrhizobium sp. HKCCYLS20291]|uniref:Kelch repeat-containing protein n=1 Tax=Bradyrhizobium sp. HKCCYLS20291 TaxID=3420766 RepID=UPI003EB74D76
MTDETLARELGIGDAAQDKQNKPESSNLPVAPAAPDSRKDLMTDGAVPPARYGQVMASDGQRMVMFGGAVSGSGATVYLNDTWIFSGRVWQQLSPTTSPPARAFGVMTYDGQQFVLFGGANGEPSHLNDTWTFDGINWTSITSSSSPSGRMGAGMIYDGHRSVLFGGSDGSLELSDTWTFDGISWRQLNPVTTPPARYNHVMGFDAVRQQTIISCGIGYFDKNDTWIFDGTNWTQLQPVNAPSLRSGAACGFDGQRVLIFGGYFGSQPNYDDTWSFQDNVWTQLEPTNNPPPLCFAKMAWDGHELVLFGGADSLNQTQNATWLLSGNTWKALSVALESVTFDGRVLDLTWACLGAIPSGTTFSLSITSLGSTLVDENVGPAYPAAATENAFCWRLDLSALPLSVLSMSAVTVNLVGTGSGSTSMPIYILKPLIVRTVYQGGTLAGGLQYLVTALNQDYNGQSPPQFIATVSWNGTPCYSTSILTSTMDPSGNPQVMLSLPATLPFFAGSSQIPPGLELEVSLAQANGISTGPAGPAARLLIATPEFVTVSQQDGSLAVTLAYPPDGPPQNAAQVTIWRGDGTVLAVTTVVGTTASIPVALNAGPGYTATVAALAGESVGPPSTPVDLFSSAPQLTTVSYDGTTVRASWSPIAGVPGMTGVMVSVSSGGVVVASTTVNDTGAALDVPAGPAGLTVQTRIIGPQVQGPASQAVGVCTLKPLIVRTVYQGGTLATGLQYLVTALNQDYSGQSPPQFIATVSWNGTPCYTTSILTSTMDPSGNPQVMLSLPATLPFFAGSYQIPPGLELEVALAEANGISTGPAGPAARLLIATPEITAANFSPFADVKAIGEPQDRTRDIEGTADSKGMPDHDRSTPAAQPLAATHTAGAAGGRPVPPVRACQMMASDGKHAVMFGGTGKSDTWMFSAGCWQSVSVEASPPARGNAAMAYGNQRFVLFGGSESSTFFDDTWAFDGSNWTAIPTSKSPPARHSCAIVYDGKRFIMFGGVGTNNSLFNDIWAFDGTDWTELPTTTRPDARWSFTMGFDGQRCILFGGLDLQDNIFNDTWAFDGTNWTQLHPQNTPPARWASAYACDGRRFVVFGGWSSGPLSDTWSFQENQWTQLLPTVSPTANFNAAMAFDAQQFVLFGGEVGDGATWLLRDDDWSKWCPDPVTGSLAVTIAFPPEGPPQSAALVKVWQGDTAVMATTIVGTTARFPVTLDANANYSATAAILAGESAGPTSSSIQLLTSKPQLTAVSYDGTTLRASWNPISGVAGMSGVMVNITSGGMVVASTTVDDISAAVNVPAGAGKLAVQARIVGDHAEGPSANVELITVVPSKLSAITDPIAGTTTISWIAPDGFTVFNLAVYTDGQQTGQVLAITATEYTFPNALSPNTHVAVGVAAVQTLDATTVTGPYSAPYQLPTATPDLLSVEYDGNIATVHWSPLAAASGYTVSILASGAAAPIASCSSGAAVTSAAIALTSPDPSRQYSVVVQALVDGNSGPPSIAKPLFSPALFLSSAPASKQSPYIFPGTSLALAPSDIQLYLPDLGLGKVLTGLPITQGAFTLANNANPNTSSTFPYTVSIPASSEAWTFAAAPVRSELQADWVSFLKAAEVSGVVPWGISALQLAVSRAMPQTFLETLYYAYGLDLGRGYADLRPGMVLRVAFANYVNVPGSQVPSWIEGYGGGSTIDYDVSAYVNSGGWRLGFDTFTSQLVAAGVLTVSAPPSSPGPQTEAGIANAADLFYPAFCQPFYRLFFPSELVSPSGAGTILTASNFVLAAAPSFTTLMNSVNYPGTNNVVAFFRGRAVVTLCIRVTINDQDQIVPIGTTVGNILERSAQRPPGAALAINGLRLERVCGPGVIDPSAGFQVGKSLRVRLDWTTMSIYGPAQDSLSLPLLHGDRLTIGL